MQMSLEIVFSDLNHTQDIMSDRLIYEQAKEEG